MIRTLRHRVVIPLLATIVAAAIGACMGYQVGRAVTLRLAADRLLQFATRLMTKSDEASKESRTLLATLNASPYSHCSDTELAYFRSLIFQTKALRDAGRIRNGQIDCSAIMGRVMKPIALPRPDFSQMDGTSVYKSFPSLHVGDLPVIGLQLGDAYVVFSAYLLSDLESLPMRHATSVVDPQSHQLHQLIGEQAGMQGDVLTRNGEIRRHGMLYATRCSTQYFNCVTAYISVHEALQADHGHLIAYLFLGGFTGGCFGLVCSLIYRRSQSLAKQLRRAIRQDKLWIAYQPIVELASGRIVGAEALARWSDEDGVEVVAPDVFVAIAEERGFVGELTELVVRHALRDLGEALRNRPQFQVNVNVTASDLGDAKFLPMLATSLAKAGLEQQRLAIEITESSTARKEVAIETIRRLRQRGHCVLLDDFGTGYSSLAYLKDLSVDVIKIDKAFTHAIGTEAVIEDILPQILALADALNLQVIVEGIETVEQAGYFAGLEKPVLGQGWLFGRPVSANELTANLAATERRAETFAGEA